MSETTKEDKPVTKKTLCLKFWRHPVDRFCWIRIARWSETGMVGKQ